MRLASFTIGHGSGKTEVFLVRHKAEGAPGNYFQDALILMGDWRSILS